MVFTLDPYYLWAYIYYSTARNVRITNFIVAKLKSEDSGTVYTILGHAHYVLATPTNYCVYLRMEVNYLRELRARARAAS